MGGILASDKTDLVTAWATVVGSGAAVSTALIALVAAIIALRQLKASRDESKERSRPMVGVDLRPSRYAYTDFVVRNYGPSAAYNVKLSVDPPFEQMSGDLRDFGRHITRRYEHPIPTLMGGSELTNVIASLSLGDQPQVGNERFTVKVTYGDMPDRTNTYTDQYIFDPAVIALETKATSNRDPEVSLGKLAKAMDSMASEINFARRGWSMQPPRPFNDQEN
ncbi:hypothetical protein NQ854_25365 [Rhodococcus ruber]|uniref:hypothetical protein n=1 Tax=Rhodococcus ruber TaxID=1830 RepID=UPI00387DD62F